MRAFFVAAALFAALFPASPALAGDAHLSRLDPAVVSAHCGALASFSAPTQLIQLEVRISVASCVASEALDRTPRQRPSRALAELGAGVAPAIALLDEVLDQAGDQPRAAIIANSAKANIYISVVVRARSMLPSMVASPDDVMVALEDAHRALELEAVPLVDQAEISYSAIAALARLHPELHDPVIQTAVRDSHIALDATPLSASR